MSFGINFEDDGYVVGVTMMHEGRMQFRRMRKFWRQGDAIDYKLIDAPKLSDKVLEMTIKKYNPCELWLRNKAMSYNRYKITTKI